MGAREVMNELKWGGRNDLGAAEITIVHRGAPGDRRVVKGSEIIELGHGFMLVNSSEGEVYIPYHRVARIEVDNNVKYEKFNTEHPLLDFSTPKQIVY